MRRYLPALDYGSATARCGAASAPGVLFDAARYQCPLSGADVRLGEMHAGVPGTGNTELLQYRRAVP